MSGLRSRNKGAAGEREAIAVLASCGLAARRTASMQASGAGSAGCGDLAVLERDWHVEVKRGKRVDLPAAVRQARSDCGSRPWIVLAREDRKPWVAAVAADPTHTTGHAWRVRKQRAMDVAYHAASPATIPLVARDAEAAGCVRVGSPAAIIAELEASHARG